MQPLVPETIATIRHAELPDADRLNDPAIVAFDREKVATDLRRSHMFHGRFENIYIPVDRIPEFMPIRRFVVDMAAAALGVDRSQLRHGFWFNEMGPGHRTTLHSHEELDERLSAVYYLSCPPDSGRLILHDAPARIVIRPRPGLLVLFAPDLPHEVETNHSGTRRLSVAFNFGPADEES